MLTDVLTEQGAAVATDIGPSAVFVTQDVSEPEGWDEVVAAATQAFGRIDILINNAAIAPAVEARSHGARGVQRGLPRQPARCVPRDASRPRTDARPGGGSIVNISSVAGLKGSVSLFAYGATKWAVRGMTQSAALELARYNIRVNAIFPGVIDTPINYGLPPKMTETLVRTTPMRRMGEAIEIANAVLFLVSPGASFATGAELAIDGGMSI